MDGRLKRHQTNGAYSWTKLVDRYERFRDWNGLYFGGDIFLAILAIVRRRHQVDPWVFKVDDARRSVFDIKRHERPFIDPFHPVKMQVESACYDWPFLFRIISHFVQHLVAQFSSGAFTLRLFQHFG